MAKNKNNLEFHPEHYYDKDGFLKPSRFYIVAIIYMLRGYFISAFASSYGSDTNAILGVLYPNSTALYTALLTGIPALIAGAIITYRSWFRASNKSFILKTIRPLIVLGLLLDLTVQFYVIAASHWAFDLFRALSLFIAIVLIYLCTKNSSRLSRHLN